MQLCSKSWILILKCIWKKQLSMRIQNWSHSAARPPKFSRVNEVVVSSTQPLEMTQIYLNDEVPCEGLENLCSILCFLVICLFYWQAATKVCAFPPGLQEEIHRDIHRKKPSMVWAGQSFVQLSSLQEPRCDRSEVSVWSVHQKHSKGYNLLLIIIITTTSCASQTSSS